MISSTEKTSPICRAQNSLFLMSLDPRYKNRVMPAATNNRLLWVRSYEEMPVSAYVTAWFFQAGIRRVADGLDHIRATTPEHADWITPAATSRTAVGPMPCRYE